MRLLRAVRHYLRCLVVRPCDPVRHPLGGFRCDQCSFAAAELGDFPRYSGLGSVPLKRRLLSRDAAVSVSQTSAWKPTRRGW